MLSRIFSGTKISLTTIMNPSIISVEIRLIREKLNLTQRDFGALFSLSESMINRIERGSRKFPDTELPKLAELKNRMQATDAGLFSPPVPAVSDTSGEILKLESELTALNIQLKGKEQKLFLLEKKYLESKRNLTIFSSERNLVFDEKIHLRQIKSYRKKQEKDFHKSAPQQLQILRFRIDVLSFSISKLQMLIQFLKEN